MIIGTAGHVDHGKTTLVRALTGVNTDRLPDEQRRGITIDLGFAPLPLDDGRIASIVDVPGHESLVHTMIAGAAGIRVALVVVAADEGVMPQTREHLRVLTALGVDRAVVALSKADLADAERLAAVARDVRELLRASSLRADEPIAVSIADHRGVTEVRAALVTAVASLPPRDSDDLFRCFVDRAFVVKGTGTVVTGTIASGSIATGERVTILPGGRTIRVRAIEAHGKAIGDARAGTRAALALADITPAELPRGTVLVTSDAWSCSTRLTARIVLAGHRSLSRRCMLHLGGTAAIARVVPLAQPAANTPVVAQITLDRPLVARRGDRFVLRSTDPSDTIGGGVILDSAPERGTRSAIEGAASAPADALAVMLAATRGAGLSRDELPVRLGITPARVASVVEQIGAVVIGARVLSRTSYDALIATAEERVRAWCNGNPLAEGMPLAELRTELRSTLRATDDVVASVLRDIIERGAVVARGGMVAATDRSSLPASDAALLARLLHRVRQSGREPPSVAELSAELGPSVPELLTFATRRGNLVRVESVRYYGAETITELEADVRRNMQPGRAYQPSELRAIVGVSRKYLIPLLEYLDSVGVTERNSGGRTLRTVSSA